MKHKNNKFIKLKTVITTFITASLFLCIGMRSVWAQEITAINFNGDLIGKVIPDGKVVGFDNQLIGNVTADSLIVNFDGRLIGGVIPQGIAIGNDAKLLGKVNNDGSVRLPSGQIVGKVLPNGLVVNDYFDIIGGVLFPGLVYSDSGATVGRVTGDGLYTNLQGQQIGIITPDGYAYRQAGGEFVLDGRLISSKMVVSLNGEFIGSVVPGGEVSDFDSKIIGRIKANGYVYNAENQIIGSIVKSGYAFDNNGFYIGFVTYNGEVIDNEKLIGTLRADGKIVDNGRNVIGYKVDIAATATDLRGKYLGRIMPDGNLSRAREISALVGARGSIFGSDGTQVGQLVKTGPIYDFKGGLRGHALPNGSTINLRGTPIGYMIGGDAYDLSGRMVGGTIRNLLVYNNQNKLLGLSGIGSSLNDNGGNAIISPMGYVFSPEGELSGSTQELGPVYSPNGTLSGYSTFDGKVAARGNILGDLLPSGFLIDGDRKMIGKAIEAVYAISGNTLLGSLSEQNLVMNTTLNIVGKILPDSSVAKASSNSSPDYMPKVGEAFQAKIVLDISGNLIGYADINGNVSDPKGNTLGRVSSQGLVIDTNGTVIGQTQNYGSILNNNCVVSGVVTPRGDIQNFRGIYLGKLLNNGIAVSDGYNPIGFYHQPGVVNDANGNLIGFSTRDGSVLNLNNEKIGCVDRYGKIRNNDNVLLGKTVEYLSSIDFAGKIIGYSTLNGQIVNAENVVSGYQQPNDNVNSMSGLPIGMLFKYKYAFDMENKYLGRVTQDATVINDKQENIGTVDFDGYVIANGAKVGYALYDLYIYDNQDNVLGYINRSGDVLSLSNQNIGKIDRGFLLDNDKKVIGRGNRDYNIREKTRLVIGRLMLDGSVLNDNLQKVGTLQENGDIKNQNNEVIAKATSLQYYSQVSSDAKRRMLFDKDGNFIGYVDENGNIIDKDGNIIGHVDENGNLISKDGRKMIFDKDGNFIGYLDENGNLVDKDGNIIGKLDENGNIIDKNGNIIASADSGIADIANRPVYDKDGNLIGLSDANGIVRDANGKIIGQVNENGDVVDANGNIIGGISSNWYQKAPTYKTSAPKETTNPALELLESGKYRRSLGIALTPDGEYLGEILEDNSVVDDDGEYLGRLMPDGLVIDDEGTLIGIKEAPKVEKEQSGMFVPPGTFGNGGAYGVGNGPAGNLGPGGGYGPGERYSPARQAALNAAMAERRKNISVGKISSNYRKEAFDGMQKDWSEQGIGKVISSWRVDMSEMIFADKPIPAVISRSIDGNNPAPITAFVERNVYAEEGRNVIIPAGSRLIGSLGGITASSEATSESARVQITWERLIRPDGSLFVFQGLTGDAQGRAGALGYVDQQLFKKYTLPIMTSTLTSATSYYMAPTSDTTGETETPRQQAANDARENFLNEMNQIFDEILADKSNIKPMTYIPAGTRIIVYPNTDLWLRTVERDQDESLNLQKPTVFIDDGKTGAERKSVESDSLKSKSVSAANSDVVYDESGVNATPATPLIDNPKPVNKTTSTATGGMTVSAPPPPPSSPSYNDNNSSSSTNNDGVPALF